MPSRQTYREVLQLRADLWRIPFALCIATLVFFFVTIQIDRAAARGVVTLPAWISVGGADDARAILGSMLGAVSTVLALIFSVALLVLSMAVSQFGPRILYRFVRDGITQVTIGLFFGTFLHTLLGFVVTRGGPTREFVPQLTVMCSVVLVIASFTLLIVFSHRIAMSIQTQNVVARIVTDLDGALAEMRDMLRGNSVLASTPEASAERDALVARCAAEGGVVRVPRTGFIQEISIASLLAAAEGVDAVVRLLYRPGQFVVENAPLCQVLPKAKTPDLVAAIRRDVTIGTHRTLRQDVEFGMAQLVEIALRALSSAINDTFTGLTCIDWLGDELRVFSTYVVERGACLGPSGAIRLMWPPLRLERLVKTAFDQIRQAGVHNPAVSIRLLQTFARLGEQSENPQLRHALSDQAEAVWEAVSVPALVKTDRADIEAAYRRARIALGASL
jgi:uncharacterized membrane protein